MHGDAAAVGGRSGSEGGGVCGVMGGGGVLSWRRIRLALESSTGF